MQINHYQIYLVFLIRRLQFCQQIEFNTLEFNNSFPVLGHLDMPLISILILIWQFRLSQFDMKLTVPIIKQNTLDLNRLKEDVSNDSFRTIDSAVLLVSLRLVNQYTNITDPLEEVDSLKPFNVTVDDLFQMDSIISSAALESERIIWDRIN